MIIDGRALAEDLALEFRGTLLLSPRSLKLLVVQVGDDPATESFVRMKKRFAEKVGISVVIEKLPNTAPEEEVMLLIAEANKDTSVTGIIVQLPLPQHLNTKNILDSIDVAKDPDLLSLKSKELFRSGQSKILPPVVGAVELILSRYHVALGELNVVVVGFGSLVGEPVSTWLSNLGVEHALVTSETLGREKIIKGAELIISGAGSPGYIKPEMISEGVVIIDAGTSESGGVVRGDADPGCESLASLMTPVPGGVGPVAVAMLFQNLLTLGAVAEVE